MPLQDRISQIVTSAETHAARSVNSAQVLANWLIGREIFLAEQGGTERAIYGEKIIPELAKKFKSAGLKGLGSTNLKLFRAFHLSYPNLLEGAISHTLRDQFRLQTTEINQTPRREPEATSEEHPAPIRHALRDEFKPGQFTPNLSWTHYRTLLKVPRPEARSFYEIEALQNSWSARELDRQISSLLFDRLAQSTDKKGLLKLASEGHHPQSPAHIFKDPFIIEFLGLPESEKLIESDLESALLANLQTFLLELGNGFAFLARQQRLTLEGDHFYVDLVFYHTILKCYVLIDLKVGKLTHEDLGQLQLYVNYYDRERRAPDDNPTLGLILATDKNDTMVQYTLAEDQKAIFTSRYQLHLPTEDQLISKIEQELHNLS